ncbi:hypothetical protein [Benzoatithermus flavus]|uniref:Lipoprotein n=1 Tax=Benzoatithermus flavus TaxID=3108223 RepID=A0ABU8XXG5_9PROT
MAEARNGPLLALGCLLALAGCVDMFTASSAPVIARWQGDTRPAPEGTAIVWHGTTTAGSTTAAVCAPLAFDVTVHRDPLTIPAAVNGRAYPTTAPEGVGQHVSGALTSWWIEGYQNSDNFVELESKMQRPVFFRARPYSVWRGIQDGNRIVLVESGSPCGRELVLTRR